MTGTEQKIIVDHVVFSSAGGAGLAAKRIVEAQQSVGIDAHLVSRTTDQLGSRGAREPRLVFNSLFDHLVVRRASTDSLFSVSRASVAGNVYLRHDALLHLHWIPGVLSLQELAELVSIKSSLILTLHDMWFLSGGCHFSQGCEEFRFGCRKCPLVRKPFENLVSRQFARKKSIFSKFQKVVVMSPGEDQLRLARASDVFPPSTNFIHIPNPLPHYELLSPKHRIIQNQRICIALIANDLSEKRKRVALALSAFDSLQKKLGVSNELSLVLIGSNPPEFIKQRGISAIGKVGGHNQLRSILSGVQLVWSFSSEEVFPNTVTECASLGIPLILSNISAHEFAVRNGFAEVFECEADAVDLTLKIMRDPGRYEQMSVSGYLFAAQLSPARIGSRYLETYHTLFS